jgi:Fibronectin type III domain
LLVLLGAGVAPSGTNAAAGPTPLAASQTLSQAAPVPSATPAPLAEPGAPGFKVVPAAQIGRLPASTSSEPFFRGGVHSRAGATTSSTAPAPRVATASPKIALYNNLNKPGQTAAPSGGYTPPDSTGAIGPSNYVEMTNSSLAVYDRSLNLVSTTSLDAFIGQPLGVPLCDPQIQWDPTANRWLYTFLYCNVQSSLQRLLLGWSRNSDPSNVTSAGWCQFAVVNDPNLFDYPKLGHNSKYLIVGGNLYSESTPSTNPPFVSAEIIWAPLPANGDTSCTTPSSLGTSPFPLRNGDNATLSFTPVPVNTDSSATDGYVVSAYDPGGNINNSGVVTTQRKLAVWHLDAAGVLHPDPDIPVNSYTVPFSAPQSGGGTTDVIDTLDGRLTQAVGDPTTGIWTQHTVNGPGNRSVVDWYELTFPGSNPIQQGIVSSSTDFIFNAAISPTSDAQSAAIEYNRSSASIFPVIAAQARGAGTTANQMEPGELILATSSATDMDFSCNNPVLTPPVPCRWGDYSAATPDPVQTAVVWGTNEFITATSFNPPGWSNENFALLVEGPTGVMARAGDQSAWVGWAPSTFDSGTPTTSYKLTAYVGVSPVATLTVSAPATAAIFKGLTNGTTYTFTVIAINVFGPSPESAHSNPVTPTRAVQQLSSPAPTPSRSPVNPAPTATPAPR